MQKVLRIQKKRVMFWYFSRRIKLILRISDFLPLLKIDRGYENDTSIFSME